MACSSNKLKPMGNIVIFLLLAISLVNFTSSKKANIYFDAEISQIAFAANDIKSALEAKDILVELHSLTEYGNISNGNNIVLLTKSDTSVLNQINKSEKEPISNLEEQAFEIRTFEKEGLTYWVVGGDVNGAMYGGLQLAEDINFNGLKAVNESDSPDIKKRGIKFNIPFDKRSPTYYGNGFSKIDFRGTSTRNAIADVWDITFWEEWFDQMARFRYNAISLWSLNPFTSMIKLDDYPDVALQDVQGFDGFSKKMTIDEKIAFWQKVMTLAKNRGFEFYIYNWNIYTYGADGKYGIDNNPRNENTKTYFRKSITKLFETYPDLNGFGVTAGENTGGLTNDEEVDWVMESYGQGIIDYAIANKDRDIVFIMRYHDTNAKAVVEKFLSMADLPNVHLDFSFKYAVAHIYSVTSPDWIRTRNGNVPEQLRQLNKKTWLELRNDDFYHLHWGNPNFVKEYINNFPDREQIIQGYFMGSDGYTHTRVFNSKAEWAKGIMEIDRQWYTFMLWGRLGFNLNLSDEVFKQTLAFKYGNIDSEKLFEAWSIASKGIPLFTELIQGDWKADWSWYPEACSSLSSGFRTIDEMIKTFPPPGSKLCSIKETAKNNCGDKISALEVADSIETYANRALEILGEVDDFPVSELETNRTNLKAMATLSLYYAEKARAAVYKASDKLDEATKALEKASEHWHIYSGLMHNMFTGSDLQRSRPITDWHMMDSLVVKEYKNLQKINEK
jgi:hypothetical protein